jgi:hypothetical protein
LPNDAPLAEEFELVLLLRLILTGAEIMGPPNVSKALRAANELNALVFVPPGLIMRSSFSASLMYIAASINTLKLSLAVRDGLGGGLLYPLLFTTLETMATVVVLVVLAACEVILDANNVSMFGCLLRACSTACSRKRLLFWALRCQRFMATHCTFANKCIQKLRMYNLNVNVYQLTHDAARPNRFIRKNADKCCDDCVRG